MAHDEIVELIAFDTFIEPLLNRGTHELIAALRASYINGHLAQGARPYRVEDLIPWSDLNHARISGEFSSGNQLLAALNGQ